MEGNKKMGFWERLGLITGAITLATATEIVSSSKDYSVSHRENPALVIAHRGASAYAPGNTVEAFEKAVEQSADTIELDLRKTRDDVYVACHDSEIGGKSISEMSYEELKKVAVKVPRLEDVLRGFVGRVNFNFDLKEEGYEIELVKYLSQHLETSQFMLTSQHVDSIRKIEGKNSDVQTGLVMLKGGSAWGSEFRKRRKAVKSNPEDYLKDAVDAGVDFIIFYYSRL